MNTLSAVGFPVETQEEYRKLLLHAAGEGQLLRTRRGYYIRWAPGEGIQMWLQLAGHHIIGFHPHFTGMGRMRIGISGIAADGPTPLDGRIQGWVEPDRRNPSRGLFPCEFGVPNFDMIRAGLRRPSTVTVQLAAFADELTCFETDHAFAASQKQRRHVAPESFIPSSILEPGAGEDERSYAAIAGHVLRARLLQNPLTRRPFWAIGVQTVGGTVDVVADPETVTGEPLIGGVVTGMCWLSGRLVPNRDPAASAMKKLLG